MTSKERNALWKQSQDQLGKDLNPATIFVLPDEFYEYEGKTLLWAGTAILLMLLLVVIIAAIIII